MFNNVALDVFIGLVFVYLIYSLLATVLQEIIATNIGLRALILRKAIRRMLDDHESGTVQKYSSELKHLVCVENSQKKAIEDRIDTVIKAIKEQPCYKYNNGNLSLYASEIKKTICITDTAAQKQLEDEIDSVISLIAEQECYHGKKLSDAFYKHPLIKYLADGSWPLTKRPSYIDKTSFSKVVIDLLRGRSTQPGDSSRQAIQQSLDAGFIAWDPTVAIQHETLLYLRSTWADAQGDVDKLKALLEQWFDEMMERTTGWYKKYTQLILLGIGLGVAMLFNVDTISIYKILSRDKQAREQLVQMAIKDTSRMRATVNDLKKSQAQPTSGQDQIYYKTYQSLT